MTDPGEAGDPGRPAGTDEPAAADASGGQEPAAPVGIRLVLDPDDPDVVLDDERRAVLREHARVIAAGGDPDTPLTAAHAFRPPPGFSPRQGLALLAAMAFVMLSGLVSGALVDALGVRLLSLLLLAVAWYAARGLPADGPAATHAPTAAERRLLLGTLLLAALSGWPTLLMLLPAFVHAVAARLILATLGEGPSLIESAARLSHPLAPAFIRPYCRRLTALWGTAFAGSAGLAAVLALAGDVEAHRAWTGWQFWTLLMLFSAGEFLWRKAWFRYFGRGPIDRLLARIFPPENTVRGRRSQDYLDRMRAELARLAEAERQTAASPPSAD